MDDRDVGDYFVRHVVRSYSAERAAIENPTTLTALMVMAIGVAGALTFAAWGMHWRSAGYAFPSEPGQWLLVEVAVAAIAAMSWLLGSFPALSIDADFMVAYQVVYGLAIIVGLAAFNLYVALLRCGARDQWWKALFAYLAASPLIVLAIASFGLPFAEWARIPALALLIGASLVDWQRGAPRHWTHWFGAGIGLAVGVATYVLA